MTDREKRESTCSRKTASGNCFPCYSHADRSLRRLRRKRTYRGVEAVHVYRCDVCAGWHHGAGIGAGPAARRLLPAAKKRIAAPEAARRGCEGVFGRLRGGFEDMETTVIVSVRAR